jgi:hypothetical protein
MWPTQMQTFFLHLTMFRAPFIPSSHETFLVNSFHFVQWHITFSFALVGLSKRSIFGSLSFFICKSWASHPNLPFIIALESGIKEQFLCCLLLYGHANKYLQLSSANSYDKHLVYLPQPLPLHRSPHVSRECFTIIITMASNIQWPALFNVQN